MEHLFKLKKNGKTVGYEKRAEYRVSDDDLAIFSSFDGVDWFENELTRGYNSAHPFVTKDKNGKDVFAGDNISFGLTKGFSTNKRYTGKVYWCKKRLAFCVNALPAWDIRIGHNCKDIELIEDKE